MNKVAMYKEEIVKMATLSSPNWEEEMAEKKRKYRKHPDKVNLSLNAPYPKFDKPEERAKRLLKHTGIGTLAGIGLGALLGSKVKPASLSSADGALQGALALGSAGVAGGFLSGAIKESKKYEKQLKDRYNYEAEFY